MVCWKEGESPPAPASNSPPPSSSPVLFDEEDAEDNAAASSLEQKAGDSPAAPASNCKDVPPDGQSVKDNVDPTPPPPHSSAPSNPAPCDDSRPYVLIRGKRFYVPEGYPKGAEGRLVNDQQFIDDLTNMFVKDIREACARNTNPRAKPKSSDTKSDLIFKRVFADYL